ncbi:MAG: hypothetical protein RIT03_1091 [Bacteroidota bacterium]|jgi:ribosomal protein S18 acetylase RimI-like enzyme
MIIRKATAHDSEFIATYLILAMQDILYAFLGTKDYKQARKFMLHFIAHENNQYSYQNCYVAEQENAIVGAVNCYDGKLFVQLREPILDYVRANYNANFNPENETETGEYYIDALGVEPKLQGTGIGKRIVQFLIDTYVVQKKATLGLLVDEANPNAKKLYVKHGFKAVGKKSLVGHNMEHLQLKPTSYKNNDTKLRLATQ